MKLPAVTALFSTLVVIVLLVNVASGEAGDFCLSLTELPTTIDRPVWLLSPGNGDDRLFVVSQTGDILVMSAAGDDQQVFFDFAAKPAPELRAPQPSEQGVLGFAFHPQYNETGLFYVYYSTDGDGSENHDSVLSEFRVSGDPDVADASSERELFRVAQPYGNHNGGWLDFGPEDGLLYLALGDGGSGGDPDANGQNPETALGSIVRFDLEAETEEIWAWGLRNPWRCSWTSFEDAPGEQWMFCGDVGQNLYEEIDLIGPSGGNFGWKNLEGHCGYSGCFKDDAVEPINVYGREVGVSICGGFMLEESAYGAVAGGHYLFGDLGKGLLVLTPGNGASPTTIWTPEYACLADGEVDAFGADTAPTLFANKRLYSFGKGPDGTLYALTAESGLGRIYRVDVEAPCSSTPDCPAYAYPTTPFWPQCQREAVPESSGECLTGTQAWTVFFAFIGLLGLTGVVGLVVVRQRVRAEALAEAGGSEAKKPSVEEEAGESTELVE